MEDKVFYLSRAVDGSGFATRFNYTEVTDEYGMPGLRLTSVGDQANDTLFTVQYASMGQYPHLINL